VPGKREEEILAKALKRQEELRRESEALNRIIETYTGILKARAEEPPSAADQLDLWRGGSRRSLHSAQVAEMMDEVRRLIVAERRPLKRGQIARMLQARGFQIIGKDKNKVLGTNMWRSGKFRHLEGRGYWPIDVPEPQERL
jgi:hypothetical protein